MPKMCSLWGAPVDAILVQQRTEMQATSVLNSYLESTWHANAAAHAGGPTCVLPGVPGVPHGWRRPVQGLGLCCGTSGWTGLPLELGSREAKARPGYLSHWGVANAVISWKYGVKQGLSSDILWCCMWYLTGYAGICIAYLLVMY